MVFYLQGNTLPTTHTLIVCDKCGYRLRSTNLTRHQAGAQCKTVVCNTCNTAVSFLDRKDHDQKHVRGRTRLENLPPSRLTSAPEQPDFQMFPEFEDIYTTFYSYIRPYVKQGRLRTIYNYQFLELTPVFVADLMSQIFNCQQNVFKVNISMSYILKNIETGEYCFYWSTANNQLLFDEPRLIHNHDDYVAFREQILGLNLEDRISRPNTKFVVVKTTNITFYITKLPGIPIGSPPLSTFPDYLRDNRGLYSLVTSEKTGKLYNDKLCFFRCIALFRGFRIGALEAETKRLHRAFCQHINMNTDSYSGITLDELEIASSLFDVGINVYSQAEDRKTILVFRSLKQLNIMYLNLHEEHFSFIKDFRKYSTTYCCPSCDKIWQHHGNFKQHIKICDGDTREVYSNGIYSPPQTIFDQLSAYGIVIPIELRFYPYRICFDIECALSRDTGIPNTNNIAYSFKHNLASIAVCSNIDGYTEPHCFISDGSTRDLVKRTLHYMLEIAGEAHILVREIFSEYIPLIEAIDDESLKDKFDEYMMEVPVLSFNGKF